MTLEGSCRGGTHLREAEVADLEAGSGVAIQQGVLQLQIPVADLLQRTGREENGDLREPDDRASGGLPTLLRSRKRTR